LIDLKSISILVVDDEPDITNLFKEYLSEFGSKVYTSTTVDAAQKILSEQPVDLVLLDINMPRVSGLKLLETIKSNNPDVIIIMVSAVNDIEMVVRCMHMGANDYIVKPILDLNQLHLRIQRALSEKHDKFEIVNLRNKLALHNIVPEINTYSPEMKKVSFKINAVANYNTTVLLKGESGTGKEVAARTIHNSSSRASNNFVAVNCGSIPNTLLESILFGHERGAFTNANKRKIGLFEESNRGTIFLDEISETSPELQVSLLRVLESNTIRRVGGNMEIELDLRVVAATNQDIKQMVEDGKFREDLYYRLNIFQINLPALRNRIEDIPIIAEYHLNRLIKNTGKKEVSLSSAVLELFTKLNWKGNIRELINVLEYSLISCRKDEISLEDLPDYLQMESRESSFFGSRDNYARTKDKFDRQYFSNLLENMNGNISKAALAAGLSRQHFHLKLKKLGLK